MRLPHAQLQLDARPHVDGQTNPNSLVDTSTEPDHLVQFYENDDFLVEVVGEFLRAGLEAGDPLIVIATEAHRGAFVAALEAKGCDAKHAQDSGELRLFDASETLAKFMVGSMPDWALFKATIGPALQEASSRRPGSRVRAYGEMVDLLWRDGNPRAAIRLEEMWNDLQQAHSFSLLCAYVMASFYKEAGDLQRVCATHTHVLSPERSDSKLDGASVRMTAVPPHHARTLAAEIAQRRKVERALREALKEVRGKEEALRRSEHDLRDFVENATVGLHWVGPDGRISWANRAELELLGYERDEYVGRSIADFHVDAPVIQDILARLSRREELHTYEARLRAKDGSIKHVLISSNVRWDGDKFIHTRCFTRDITERKVLELRREVSARRTELLGKITAAIADAITPDQVVEAVVDQVASALDASSAGLWLLAEDGRTARLLHAIGYSEEAKKGLKELPLDSEKSIPAIDCARAATPIWLDSQEELLERYPHLSTVATKGRAYRIACLPIIVQNKRLGSLAFTFDGTPSLDEEYRTFLMLVARHAGQALERLRLLDEERESRARAECAAVRLELLYGLAAAVNSADQLEQVFDIALDGIARALGASRSSILTFDADGVMRFKGWRGLSDAYRKAVEGHSPWSRDVRSPAPILIADAQRDPAMSPYLSLFESEGIRALGFIPLESSGRLLGKFMVY